MSKITTHKRKTKNGLTTVKAHDRDQKGKPWVLTVNGETISIYARGSAMTSWNEFQKKFKQWEATRPDLIGAKVSVESPDGCNMEATVSK